MDEVERRSRMNQLLYFMLYGDEEELEADRRSFEEQVDEASLAIERMAKEFGGGDDDKAYQIMEKIHDAIYVYQEVYFEMGFRSGARFQLELLLDRHPDAKKRGAVRYKSETK